MKARKRILSLLLSIVMLLGLLPAAAAVNTYYINGKAIQYTDVAWPGNSGCWTYVNNLYKLIWGVNFDSTFTGSAAAGHNMLRDLSDSDLSFTKDHLKAYVSQAALGSTIRICNSEWLHSSDGWGHSLLIVQKDDNGFTTFESWDSTTGDGRREHYWTWDEFYQSNSSLYSSSGSRYAYIKYIKWPNAPAYTATCSHSYSGVVTAAPTCTGQGYTTYICVLCGDSYVGSYTSALGHDYVNGLCTRCGAIDPSYVSGTCGDDLKWRLNTETGVLTISGTGAMENYTHYTDVPWYDYCDSITKVVIEDGVTTIGDCAFSHYDSLASVSIPRSVIKIGDHAFWGSASLTSVTIPTSVTSIGDAAFRNCKSLTSVNIPNGVTSIGKETFYYCKSLTSITIPSSVTSIGDGAFAYCSSLTSLTIPSSITSIGNSSFTFCSGLTSVTIPNSVTSIDVYTFYGCKNLTSVTIPDSVTSIGNSAFRECESLTNVTIPNSVTSIENYAFCLCTGLTSATIPNSVISIGESAFASSGLTDVTIPASVTSIGYSAFWGCTALTDIYYGGTSAQWSAISIGSDNEPLTSATIHYAGCAHSILIEAVARAATCTEPGTRKHWLCTDCGKYFLDAAATTETTLSAVTVAALGHDYVNGSCTRCGATDPSYVPDGSVGRVIVKEARGCPGDTVSITIALENNPGIITMILEVGYDTSVMTLTGVTDGGILGTAMHTDKLTMDPYQLTWNNGTAPSNFTAVGDLVTLTFTIAEDAPEGSYDITLSCSDALNYDMDEVRFLTMGSTLTVTNVLPGDVNGDGVVSIKDSVLLQRYIAKIDGYDATTVELLAADVNGDGVVNIKDSIILQRYVAKWAGYEALPYTN